MCNLYIVYYIYYRSEYWVSNKKYYCKYCKIYITDNKIVKYQCIKN